MTEKAKCAALQGSFYMFFCLVFAFNTYYLGKAGFSDRVIGILISMSCLAGGLLQAAAGRLADRYTSLIWKNQVTVLAAAEAVLAGALYFAGGGIPAGMIFACMMALSLVMVPMVNMASFYYSDRGTPVDFGLARGTGSIAFALMSFAAGRATAAWGSRMVPALAVASALLVCAIAASMPLYDDAADPGEDGKPADAFRMSPEKHRGHRRGILRKYPVFTGMIAGMFLLMFMHNVTVTYMIRIVESVGGDSGSLGTALAIAAAAELPMMFIYRRLAGRTGISDAAFVTVSGVFYVLRGILFVIAGSVGMIFFIQLLQGPSYGLLAVSRSNYANGCMEPEDRSTGQSLAAMTESMGSLAGSLAGGLLISFSGLRLMLTVSAAAAAAGTLITFICGRQRGERQ